MNFWVPGSAAPGVDREYEEEGIYMVNNTQTRMSLDQQRHDLPIYKYRREILYGFGCPLKVPSYSIETSHVTIIQGETGCGKSTQIPQYLMEAGWADGGRCIACTQPRRIAATTVARRVAEEKRVVLGEEVGYSVQFDYMFNRNGKITQIKYLTHKELLREMMRNPLLNQYSVVMVDEAHDRTINNDLLLGLLKRIIQKRQDLRLVITSATMNVDLYKRFFRDVEYRDHHDSLHPYTVLTVQGRQYPVEILYSASPVPNYVESTASTVIRIHNSTLRGDILAFLPNEETVEACKATLVERSASARTRNGQLWVVTLHPNLPAGEQRKVFQTTPRGFRKVVLATGLAETGLTIDNITCVIDSGFETVSLFDETVSIPTQQVQPISKATAKQRAGRAGRVTQGFCFRLYTESAYEEFRKRSTPETQRLLLCDAVLLTRQLGVRNLDTFDLPSEISSSRYALSCRILNLLDTLDSSLAITPRGLLVAEMPVDAQLGSFLLFAKQAQCEDFALTIAAFSGVTHLFLEPPTDVETRNEYEKTMGELIDERGDQFTYLKLYDMLVNPPVTVGDGTVRAGPREVTGGDVTLFCQEFFLNPQAVKKALELRVQYKYFLDLIPRDAVEALGEKGEEEDKEMAIMHCLIKAYFKNICKLSSNGCYVPVNLLNEEGSNEGDISVFLHEDSVLHMINTVHHWVLFKDIQLTDAIYIRDVVEVNPLEVARTIPRFYKSITGMDADKEPMPGPQLPPGQAPVGPFLPTESRTQKSTISVESLGMEDRLKDIFRFSCCY
ncbi:hypothetical protein WA588_002467 [Blastocystis sp. NMH]